MNKSDGDALKRQLEVFEKTVGRDKRRIQRLRRENYELTERIKELESKIQDFIYRQRD